MVIALAYLERLEISLDVLTYRLCVHEVHRSAGNRLALAQRNLCRIGRQILGSIESEMMAENIAVSLAVEIKIRVVGKIDHGRGIRLGCKGQTKLVLLAPVVTRHSLDSARIAHLAILGIIKELNTALILAALPDLVLEALRTAVEMVRTVIDRKSVLLAVKLELAESDTVGISAWHLSRAWTVSEIACRLRITEHHVSHIAVLVRNNRRNDAGTYIGKLHISTALILHRIKEDILSALGLAPEFLCYSHMFSVFIFLEAIFKIRIFSRLVKRNQNI